MVNGFRASESWESDFLGGGNRWNLYNSCVCYTVFEFFLNKTKLNQQLSGGVGGTRTHDQRIKSPLLYRLSYHPELHRRSPQF